MVKITNQKKKNHYMCMFRLLLRNGLFMWLTLCIAYFSFKYSLFIVILWRLNTYTISLQVAASLVTVHLIAKLTAGDAGSLSVSTLKKIATMSNKVCSCPS